jgi:hypothetical protein
MSLYFGEMRSQPETMKTAKPTVKLYVILTENFFEALALGQIKDGNLVGGGSLWCYVRFTDEEKNNYKFSICEP